jgi:hypothetical protein
MWVYDNAEKKEVCSNLDCGKLSKEDCVEHSSCTWQAYPNDFGVCLDKACNNLTEDECFVRMNCEWLAVGVGDIHICSEVSNYLPCSSLSESECQLREDDCAFDKTANGGDGSCYVDLTCDQLTEKNCSTSPFLPCRYNSAYGDDEGKCVDYLIPPIVCTSLPKVICEDNEDLCMVIGNMCVVKPFCSNYTNRSSCHDDCVWIDDEESEDEDVCCYL